MTRDKPSTTELVPQERDVDYSKVMCGSFFELANDATSSTVPLARIKGSTVETNFYFAVGTNNVGARTKLNLALLPVSIDRHVAYNYNAHCNLTDTNEAKVKMRAQIQEASELENLKKLVYVIQGNEYTIIDL